jgi:aspartate 1-decarboxylase
LESAPIEAPLHATTRNQNLIGLVNGIAVSIHHVANSARFCRVAFIFGEQASRMVNRWCPAARQAMFPA